METETTRNLLRKRRGPNMVRARESNLAERTSQ